MSDEFTQCSKCYDQGYVLWVYPERKPRPAQWFSRGPGGERPIECGCTASARLVDAKGNER